MFLFWLAPNSLLHSSSPSKCKLKIANTLVTTSTRSHAESMLAHAAHLKDITGPLLDTFQFAYQANRSVEDATWDCTTSCNTLMAQDPMQGSYPWTSGFNAIVPELLHTKLTQFSIKQLAVWCCHGNLELNMLKRAERISGVPPQHYPPSPNSTALCLPWGPSSS